MLELALSTRHLMSHWTSLTCVNIKRIPLVRVRMKIIFSTQNFFLLVTWIHYPFVWTIPLKLKTLLNYSMNELHFLRRLCRLLSCGKISQNALCIISSKPFEVERTWKLQPWHFLPVYARALEGKAQITLSKTLRTNTGKALSSPVVQDVLL